MKKLITILLFLPLFCAAQYNRVFMSTNGTTNISWQDFSTFRSFVTEGVYPKWTDTVGAAGNRIMTLSAAQATAATLLTISSAAATYQPIGSYLTTETDPLFNTKLATKTTTDLTEGANLYYTTARFNTAFAGKSTSDLSEGTRLYYTDTRARAAISVTGAGSYNSTTGVITIGSPSITVDTISTARSFNTAYQMSTTKNVLVSISATVSPSLSLSGGQTGEVYLEISANGSTNWLSHGKILVGNTGTLTVGLNITEAGGAGVTAMVPAGYYWRARTNNVTGTPTYVFTGGSKATFN